MYQLHICVVQEWVKHSQGSIAAHCVCSQMCVCMCSPVCMQPNVCVCAALCMYADCTPAVMANIRHNLHAVYARPLQEPVHMQVLDRISVMYA